MKRISDWTHYRIAGWKRGDFISIAVFFVVSLFLMVMAGQIGLLVKRNDLFSLKEGDLALKDYYIDRDVTFLDREATDRRLKMKESLIHPVFVRQQTTTKTVFREYQAFVGLITSLMESSRDRELVLEEIEAQFPGLLTLSELNTLLEPTRFARVSALAGDLLGQIMEQGVVSIPEDDQIGASGIIDIMNLSGDINDRTPWLMDRVLTKKNVESWIRRNLESRELSVADRNLVAMLVTFFYRENCFYSKQMTDSVREEILAQVEPVTISFSRGDRIIAKGSLVTGSDTQIIRAIRDRQNRIGVRYIGETLVFLAMLILLGFFSFVLFDIPLTRKKYYLLLSLTAGFELVLMLVLGLVSIPRGFLVIYFVPISLWGILVAQLTADRRTGFFSVGILSLLIMFLTDRSILTLFYAMLTGFAGVLTVNRSARRIDMLKSAAVLAVVHVVGAFLVNLYAPISLARLLAVFAAVATNGFFSGILSLAVLPLFEHFLNFCTTYRLMELSDHNSPVMKRMLALAPGTYVHSLNVANMAESACQNIGANGLLARIGGYYHDIGKIDQPEYFIENQNIANKHDDMKASLSAAVIKSHVKIGAEKGRELRLPEEVIDIINQHHGTSMIYYFYDRAMKDGQTARINEDDYRHSGPRPQSREAAVVMLSDVVEAATRTLKKPSPAKLEKTIWDLIMERFRLGELNECDLTLRDLEVIKDSFVLVLTGHFHKRIEYPETQRKEQ